MSETDSLMDDLLNGRIEYRDLTQEQRDMLRERTNADIKKIVEAFSPIRNAFAEAGEKIVAAWGDALKPAFESFRLINTDDLTEKIRIINESKANPDR